MQLVWNAKPVCMLSPLVIRGPHGAYSLIGSSYRSTQSRPNPTLGRRAESQNNFQSVQCSGPPWHRGIRDKFYVSQFLIFSVFAIFHKFFKAEDHASPTLKRWGYKFSTYPKTKMYYFKTWEIVYYSNYFIFKYTNT